MYCEDDDDDDVTEEKTKNLDKARSSTPFKSIKKKFSRAKTTSPWLQPRWDL